MKSAIRILIILLAPVAFAFANDEMKDCPMHSNHQAGVNARGNQAMGFDQEKTTHHFSTSASGGIIQVEANDAKDTENRDMIRMHLKHIASAFAEGDFQIPMFVHDRVPPGVPEMKVLSKEIQYLYEETKQGARVVITSQNKDAVSAIHEFLKFQIEDHHTGDPVS